MTYQDILFNRLRDKRSWWRGKEIEVIVVAGLVVMVCVFFYLFHSFTEEYNANLRAGYAAWCKQTDNPKHLTYGEWVALVVVMQDHDSAVIFIPR